MKKTFITLAKKISKKFVSLLLSALATAVGELVIGGVLKGFTRIKASRKSENSEPTVDAEPETKVENEVTETEEVEDKVETEEKNEEN